MSYGTTLSVEDRRSGRNGFRPVPKAQRFVRDPMTSHGVLYFGSDRNSPHPSESVGTIERRFDTVDPRSRTANVGSEAIGRDHRRHVGAVRRGTAALAWATVEALPDVGFVIARRVVRQPTHKGGR